MKTRARQQPSIPKGLRNKAQGCEERATLGKCTLHRDNPERVAADDNGNRTMPQPLWGCKLSVTLTQGSSFLATLGFVAESLWDSALGAMHSKSRRGESSPSPLNGERAGVRGETVRLIRSEFCGP